MFNDLESEFEKIGLDAVRSNIDKGLYSGRKRTAATAWVKRHDRALMNNDRKQEADSRRWEAIRSWIAIGISVVALIVAYIK